MSDTPPAALPGEWPGLTGHRAPGCSPAPPPVAPENPDRLPEDGGGRASRPAAAIRAFAMCGIAPAARSTAAAREFTDRTLTRWRLDAFVGDVTVVVSELVGNALRHGLASAPRRSHGGSPVRLGLLWQDATLLCAVSDPSSVPPVVREPDHLAERGRGLHIVGSLSRRWGWSPPDGAGKTVWAAVPVDRRP